MKRRVLAMLLSTVLTVSVLSPYSYAAEPAEITKEPATEAVEETEEAAESESAEKTEEAVETAEESEDVAESAEEQEASAEDIEKEEEAGGPSEVLEEAAVTESEEPEQGEEAAEETDKVEEPSEETAGEADKIEEPSEEAEAIDTEDYVEVEELEAAGERFEETILEDVAELDEVLEANGDGVAINAVNFPDENFRAYVSQEFDTDGNEILDSGEIVAVRDMNVGNYDIDDLTGIEYFYKLNKLDCSQNNLSSLDMSGNPSLMYLYCWQNNLSSLDVSHNPHLSRLWCHENHLGVLDVSENLDLFYLECTPQTRNISAKQTDGKWSIRLADIVGIGNLNKVTIDTESQKVIYSNGIITFYENTLPEELVYTYSVMDNHTMKVTLKISDNGNPEIHTWDSRTVIRAATCTGNGERLYTCTDCDETKTETIPAAGHKEGSLTVTKAATCTTAGTRQQKCTVCGAVLKTETIPAIGHTWGSWTETKTATVFEAATEVRTCSICKTTETRTSGRKLSSTMKVNASSLTLKTGQTTKVFKVTGLADGDYVKSWKSKKTSIVKVTGKSDGTCTIKAQKKTGSTSIVITLASGKTKTIKVKVQKNTVATTKISGISKKLTLKKGKSATLAPVLTPITSTQKVSYKTSNKKIVTVNSKGKLTAKKKGKAVITITSGKKSVKCTVTVK